MKPTKATGKPRASRPTAELPPRLYIRLKTSANQDELVILKQTIDAHPGDTEVVLVIGEDTKQIIRLPNRISHETGLSELETAIGKDHVKLR